MAEALLRMAERVARLGAWRVDLPGLTSTWTDEVHAIGELPAGFVPIADSSIEMYVPEDRPKVREAVAACVASGEAFDLELRLVGNDGRLMWVHVLGEAVRDAAGRICRIEGAIQDITARKLAVEEARQIRSVVAQTLEHISDGFILLDREWRYTFVNAAAIAQAGGRLDAASIGRVLWEDYPELAGTIFESTYRRAMDQNETGEVEAYFDPLASWFSVRAYPAPNGIAIWFRNITQERAAREAVRISEERFRLLSRATTDAIWDTDLVTNSTWRSDGFEKLFGYDAGDDGRGDQWGTRIHPEDRDRVIASAQQAIDGGSESWSDEYRYLRKDGTVAHVFDRGYIIRDGGGTAVRMIGGMSDVSERKKLESQLLRTQRMESIGTLAGGIAHDLNNILSPILMSVGLLKEAETDPDRLNLLDTIETSGRRGSDMVRQVLAFARGVEGKRLLVNVRHLFRDVQKMMRESIPKTIDLTFSAPHDIWTVDADVTQLHQVLMNLCVNARDAMPDGGTLKVTAANQLLDDVYTSLSGALSPGPHLVLTVSDTGSGMSRETQERIFEPFFTTKELGKGTGLGLSTVLTIVKSHGGAIEVQSEPGRGTTFTILLPAAGDTAAAAAAPAAPLPRGNGELILVVDDEEKVRALSHATLDRYGYRAIEARHGAEAVALFAQHRDVALVITDLAMPVMDGFTTMLALKSINPLIRIIASSGQSTKDGDARALDAGAAALLNKPFTVDRLIRTVHDVLNDRHRGEGDGAGTMAPT
jgi:PAS domain S-box-containing protein